MNKLNLIIDGNYILNKNTFALFKSRVLYGQLHDSLFKSLNNYKDLYSFENVFFISDYKGNTWRKKIYDDYKGSRKKDNNIDWDYVHETYNNFKDDIPNHIKVLEKKEIEGDDWIYYITKEENKKGISNLIISNDHDLKQLLTTDLSQLTINIMANEVYYKKLVFLPNSYKTYLSLIRKNAKPIDLFELEDNMSLYKFIKEFISERDIRAVNNVNELFKKIISGDTSDNIEGVYKWYTSTNKPRTIGERGAEKIIEMYEDRYGEINLKDENIYENLTTVITDYKKIPLHKTDTIHDNLIFNRKLIDLNLIPDRILEKMDY